jgi:hypothetical protein
VHVFRTALWTAPLAALVVGCAAATAPAANPSPSLPLELELERALPIDVTDDFEPSGLALYDGRLLTVSDKHDHGVYEIVLGERTARLRPFVTFTPPADEPPPLDFEGLAVDTDGALLLASETRFRVLRVGVDGSAHWITASIEAQGKSAGLFQKPNAYVEGIARLADGRLLFAAEREPRGLVELTRAGHLIAWAMPDSIYPVPPGRPADFADLTAVDDDVYALERNSHLVVRLERTTDRWAERDAWSYARTENDPRFAFADHRYGLCEGLAMDASRVFLVTDNNAGARAADATDHRPLLFVFKRPKSPHAT